MQKLLAKFIGPQTVDSLKHLAQGSVFYTIANSIEAFSPMLLAILLTRILSPEEYGIWILFIALVTFVRPIINLSLQDALRMNYYQMDVLERGSFVWSALFLSSLCLLAMLIVTWLFSASLSTLLNFPELWLLMVPVTSFLYASFYFLLAYNQFAQNRRRFLLLHLVQTGSGIVLIALLVLSDWRWQGVIVGKVAGLFLVVILGLIWMRKLLVSAAGRLTAQSLGKLARFGLLYLPTGMGLVAVPLTDRVIVSELLGMSVNGLFGAAALFGSVAFVVINGFIHAWMPWLFRKLNSDEPASKDIVIVSVLFSLGLPLAGLAIYGVSLYLAPILIGERFADALPLIPWAIAGTVSMGYFFHNQTFLHHKKALVAMSVSSFSCIILNAVFSYFGAIHFGAAGVFYATVGAFLVAACISGLFALQRYEILGKNRWVTSAAR